MSGYTMTQPELYYSLPTAVTKNTYTTQAILSAPGTTAVPRCMIPANYFSVIGKSIHFEANGTIECDSAASFTMAAALDTTGGTINASGILFTTAALAMSTSATVFPWTAEVDIVTQAIGATDTTLQVNGEVDIHGGATGAWSTARNSSMFSNSLATIDNEVNLWLELLGTWTVSGATNTTTLQQFKVYLEN
jgi:hypothetical protein